MTILIPSRNEKNILEFMEQIEKNIYPNQIITFNDRYGQGKGYALRQALTQATSIPIVFIDGDGDVPAREINKLIPYLNDYDIVVGKKEAPRTFKRRMLTRISRLYICLLFNIGVDTQTGIKAFNYKPEWNTNGWAADIEILYKAKKMGKTMIEVPIKAVVSDTKNFGDIWSTLIESLKIRFQS